MMNTYDLIDLIGRLRTVDWEVTNDGERMPDDPARKCVFVDMRPSQFRELLREAADTIEAALTMQLVLRKLVEEWRRNAREYDSSPADAIHDCANELERQLNRHGYRV